jgi:predicted DNA-binding WGR domain protein
MIVDADPNGCREALFAEAASLARIRPERNEWRLYRMEIWPDLFGRALLLRQWGRIGTRGTAPPRSTPRSGGHRPQTALGLHTVDGGRKYLTSGERDAFLRAAEQADRQVRTLCMTRWLMPDAASTPASAARAAAVSRTRSRSVLAKWVIEDADPSGVEIPRHPVGVAYRRQRPVITRRS